MTAERRRLLDVLPDTPRWVETRDLLLCEECPMLLEADPESADFVVFSPDDGLASIVGRPSATFIRQAASTVHEVLAFPENIDYATGALQGWFADEVAVHVPGDRTWSVTPPHPVRILARNEVTRLSHLPADLAEELSDVDEEGKPIAAAFDGATAVAFSYPAALSETLWDMSIDTVPSHRRRGFAQAAALCMIAHMADSRRQPVWCSAQSNPPSAALAARLGFVEVDRIWLLRKS